MSSNVSGTLYLEGDSIFHQIDPAIKLLFLALWTISTFLFLDLRISITMLIIGFGLLIFSSVNLKKIMWIFWLVVIFNFINLIFILIITPNYGSILSGHSTILLQVNAYILTDQTLLYALTIALKYLSLFPIALLFIVTTHPSRLSYSLNRVGVPYKIAYSLNIAFRYIPDIRKELQIITHAQQARGVSFEKGEAILIKRILNRISIVIPLVFSSLDRIEVISSAMELREFGQKKHRTWISKEKYTKKDIVMLIVMLILFFIMIYFRVHQKNYFWCP